MTNRKKGYLSLGFSKLMMAVFVGLILFSFPSSVKATNTALDFNGSSDYVFLPSINAGSAFSIEAWFYQDVEGEYITLFRDRYSSTNFGTVYLHSTDMNRLEWWFDNDLLDTGNTDISAETWHHFILADNPYKICGIASIKNCSKSAKR